MTPPFFEQVYQLVQQIPAGRVTTYGQIARLLGLPHAARTVGWALQALPDGRNVPWQRVINAHGNISLGLREQGAAIQRALLEEEGIAFDRQGHVDLKVYGWVGLDAVECQQLLQSLAPSPIGGQSEAA
jgi:methylated-DNA-protein-cysteine methyltransferase related protein